MKTWLPWLRTPFIHTILPRWEFRLRRKIVPGTLRLWANGQFLRENQDYTLATDGTINFKVCPRFVALNAETVVEEDGECQN